MISKIDHKSIIFNNGTYNLDSHVFTPHIQPNENPLNYIEYTDSDTKVQNTYELLKRIFPDVHTREYFLDILSSTFLGKNRTVAYFWVGDGGGKKTMKSIIEEIFIGLSCTLTPQLIYAKYSRDTNDSIADFRAKVNKDTRVAFIELPDDNRYIDPRELVSSNRVFYRELNAEAVCFNPIFKSFILGSKIHGNYDDSAMWHRIVAIPFEGGSNIDNEYASKISELIQPFTWILLQYLKNKRAATVIPAKIINTTFHMKRLNNTIEQFYTKHPVKIDTVINMELYRKYENWHEMNFPRILPLPNYNFTEEIQILRENMKIYHDELDLYIVPVLNNIIVSYL